MCGIVGFFQPNHPLNKEDMEKISKNMSSTLSHRGPDQAMGWMDAPSGLALEFRRLAILDLSENGAQPMHSVCGRYTVVYNGEIYNYLDLKKEVLSHGFSHSFRGTSDTEVLLAAITTWGFEETLKKINGMFAIALWDREIKTLSLARDRVGIKPLYFGIQNGVFYFTSELKALLAHPTFQPDIDRTAMALFFRYSYVPAPYSIYQGIEKLTPGHWVQIPFKNFPHFSPSKPFWDVRAIAKESNRKKWEPDAALEELEFLLKDSVKKQMISDVPLGAFLSGGIDSSIVTALMQSQSERPVKTFSIGFSEKDYNEAGFAKAIATHLGTDHTEQYVSAQEALDVIPKLATIYDEPFADSSQIPTYLVSKMARQKVTVALSGDGGDELFAGYNRYFYAREMWKGMRLVPGFARSFLGEGIRTIPPKAWDKIFSQLRHFPWRPLHVSHPGDKLHKVAHLISSKDPEEIYFKLISKWEDPNQILKDEVTLSGFNRVTDLTHFSERMMYFDLISYLPDDILVKVDRASMAVSLEARVPILDHKVVEFAWTLPLDLKIRGGVAKFLLKKLLSRYVPPKLFERPKMGFELPISHWLKGPLRDWCESLLSEKALQDFDAQAIRQLWKEHLNGESNWQYHLWNILMYQSWKLERT